jgi:hypothetical protein
VEGRVKLLKAGPDVRGTDSMEGRVKLMKAVPDVRGTDRDNGRGVPTKHKNNEQVLVRYLLLKNKEKYF